MLAPTVKGAWELPQVLLHVVVPLLSIIDFFIYDSNVYNHTYKNVLYCCIPPIYYLIFATIGYICNWNFGMGTNYPYFFLNYGSDAKIFGFSDKLPYIGSFYWIIILGIFVIGMSYLYIFISRKINKRTN